MASYLDLQAAESEGDGEEDQDENQFVPEKQVSGPGGVGSDDDGNEDDEDGDGVVDEQFVKDLIDDTPLDDDGSSDSDDEVTGKRKNKSDDDDLDVLDEDDFDLIEENMGVKVKRAKSFKRIRRYVDSDEEDVNSGNDRDKIANQLFDHDGSDNEGERRAPIREEAGPYASEESEDDSDADDFIVDDEGRPLKATRKKRIVTNASVQEAQEIFGVDFDYDEFGKHDDEYDEDEEDEDEEQRTVRREKKQPRPPRKEKSIYELYEPHELERAGFTDKDTKIRSEDIPERMQLRSIPITPANDEELDEEAEWIYKTAFIKRDAKKDFISNTVRKAPGTAVTVANWDEDWDKQTVVPGPAQTTVGAPAEEDWEKPAAPKAPISIPRPAATQVGEENWDEEDWDTSAPKSKPDSAPDDPDKTPAQDKPAVEVKPQIIPKIRKALEFMRNQLFEVPFIAFYRKEYVQPDLTINDLWKIYRLDARFCQLKNRKNRLIELFKNMREHQTDLIMAKPDDPISDSMRLITDDDLERIKSVKTADELKDIYLFFSLYYSDEVPTMKEQLLRKRKQVQQRAKDAAAAAAADRGEGEGGEEQPLPEYDDDLEDGLNEDIKVRRKIGGGSYGMCKKLGVDTFIKKFGLTPEKFAENLRDNYQRHEVDQYPTGPLEAAMEMCSQQLKTPEEVLKAATFMMATQISREPIVRQCVREVFFERATISCSPTKKGRKEIDEANPCFIMKYIKDKPVRDLVADQFMRLSLAEEDRLLQVIIGDKIKGIQSDDYIDEVKQLFIKDEFSKNVQDWNTLRGECIEFAFENLLYPVLRNELRAKLAEDAKEHVLNACSSKLYNYLKIAPFDVNFSDEDEGDWDTSKGLRILAIAYVPDYEQASFACLIDPDGEPSDYLRLQNIIKSSKAFKETDRQEKEADLLAVKIFIQSKKPHLIVIAGECRQALGIQADIKQVCGELVSEENFPTINVEIVDNSPAKVYANSIKSTNDFKDYPPLLKQAVSLGRRMQDPLIEFSQLCTADEEILCMRFHSLQDHVPKEELLEHLQLEFVNRTNEIGVDVNRAITYPYTANLVQFVGGLGPRKAAALIKVLKQNNQRLENRTQLITACRMGPKIFINCSGFIKIDTNALGDSTESYVEVLDGSRVHPETYEWARKMAADALEYDDEDANPASALEEILESPEKLKDLDLDAFAAELERQGFGNKGITLKDIRAELIHRYKDNRGFYENPNLEEMFYMLTKETPETLYIGQLITATVNGISHKKPEGQQLDNAVPIKNPVTGRWQCGFCWKNDFLDLHIVWAHFDDGECPGQAIGVLVRLDNDLSGFIPIGKLSDSRVANPEERVQRGQTIHCRIVKIDYERVSLECTSRTSDLLDLNGEFKRPKDQYYDQEKEDLDNKTEKEENVPKNTQRPTYNTRLIAHPLFKNIPFNEAERLLGPMDQGEVILRPGSKGPGNFSVTWKVAEKVFQHFYVREEHRDGSTGQSLWIGNEEFDDIDEIMANYVNRMAIHARDILNHKYYVNNLDGTWQKANEYLMEATKRNSGKYHYIFQASREFPGKFLLSYFAPPRPVHELITATPEGFRFRQRHFDSFEELLAWFKKNYRAPPPALMLGRLPSIKTELP